MRNQYKILAEKYSLVKEDDKGDIMAGLDYLTSLDIPLIYMTQVSTSRGELNDYPEISEVNSDYIQDTFYGRNKEYYQRWAETPDSFEELITQLKDGEIVEICSEEDSFYFSLNEQHIQNVITDKVEEYRLLAMDDGNGEED